MDLESIVREFLAESQENLDALDRALVALEQDPRDRETLASIFRTIHTIKGTTGFLGFSRLEAITHVGESLLSRLRDGSLALNPAITSGLLSMVDAIRSQLAAIEETGAEREADYAALIDLLTTPDAPAQAEESRDADPAAAEPVRGFEPDALAAADPRSREDRRSGDERRGSASADRTLRVDAGLLDMLMHLTGELLVARDAIVQCTAAADHAGLAGATERLDLVTSALHKSVSKMRMQPIGAAWSRFPRLVRDLSQTCCKLARVETHGDSTDLERTIVEALMGPLTHLVRNAVDHGIEPPDVRLAAGKDPEGTITLRASRDAGAIEIEVSDDGAGIDPDRVHVRAVQLGLLTPEQAWGMSESEIVRLVFLPGFSTAEQVTNVSGRGVGMDVVRTDIEKIGGTVDILSAPGIGTCLRIRVPPTLATIRH